MLRRAFILGLSALAALAGAQTHKVAAPEKVTRALAVYEYTGDLEKPDAARLIPVSLFIDGQFQDADVYLADPVPFALDTGIVYSIERAGDPIGTLDLDYARNIVTRRSSADDNPIGVWYGYGRFLTPAAEAKLKPKSSAKLPVVIASTDSANPDDDQAPNSSAATPPTRPPNRMPPPSRVPHRRRQPHPRLRWAPISPNPTPTTPTAPPSATATPPPTPPRRRAATSPPATSPAPAPPSTTTPTARPSIAASPKAQSTPTQLTGTPPNLHQVVAISDAATHEPHLFNREWDSSTEHAETLAALQTLAKPRIANYILTNKLSHHSPSDQ